MKWPDAFLIIYRARFVIFLPLLVWLNVIAFDISCMKSWALLNASLCRGGHNASLLSWALREKGRGTNLKSVGWVCLKALWASVIGKGGIFLHRCDKLFSMVECFLFVAPVSTPAVAAEYQTWRLPGLSEHLRAFWTTHPPNPILTVRFDRYYTILYIRVHSVSAHLIKFIYLYVSI